MSESVCAEQAFSPETYLISLLVSVSGKTTHGERFGFFEVHQRVRDDDHYVADYATARRRPFRHTAPLPRSPLMI